MHRVTEEKPATSNLDVWNGTSNGRKIIVARVPQGYHTKINIRFVPGHSTSTLFTPTVPCYQPRQGAAHRRTDPVALPESLINKLRNANKTVLSWIAKDAANAQLFLFRPVDALLKANVSLTRSEQKILERTHSMVNETMVIAPGVKIVGLSVSAHLKGRTGEPRHRPIGKNVRGESRSLNPKNRSPKKKE